MNISSADQKKICDNCGEEVPLNVRHCPTCKSDAGAPNVRACLSDTNIQALSDRYKKASEKCKENNCLSEFDECSKKIKEDSGVVITMPTNVLRNLFSDPNQAYTNYESLVGSGSRTPATPKNDSHRVAITGILFGTYGKNIMYGTLSLNNEGLPTYGKVKCRLRSITIKNRTSFLETNSYNFVSTHNISPGDELPAGFMSDWENRNKLALAKIANNLEPDQSTDDWVNLIINSDGTNRGNDEFIEAHTYEGFDSKAVEEIELIENNLKRDEKLDFDFALTKLKDRSS